MQWVFTLEVFFKKLYNMIDDRAIVHSNAKIHKTATVSAYAIVGNNVEIGAEVVVDSHAIIQCFSKIGKNNHI